MMTSSWLRRCLNIGLASSLAMGGIIASSGDYALSKNNFDATLRTERSVATPNIAIQDVFPADTDSPSESILVVQSLQCHSTDAGGTNPDQVSLYINNQLVWGPSPMSAEDTADLTTVRGTVFKNTVRVKLVIGSKHLGPVNFSSGSGGSIPFINGTASYTLINQTIPEDL